MLVFHTLSEIVIYQVQFDDTVFEKLGELHHEIVSLQLAVTTTDQFVQPLGLYDVIDQTGGVASIQVLPDLVYHELQLQLQLFIPFPSDVKYEFEGFVQFHLLLLLIGE